MKKEYYREYYDFIHEVISFYLDEMEASRNDLLSLYGHNIRVPLADWLFLIHINMRDEYGELRSQGYSYNYLKQLIGQIIKDKYPYDCFPRNNKKDEFTEIPSFRELSDYADCPVFYSYNIRDVEYLKPILSVMTQPVVLLVDFEFDNEPDLGEHVQVIEFEPMIFQNFFNPYLQQYFPNIYYYFITFYTIFYYMRPSCFICTEGCHYTQKTGALISNQMGVSSVCLQRSWPSLFHTRLRDMEYTRFFTWGDFFNPLWEKYNAIPAFTSVGYMYKVEQKQSSNKVTFFLQSPQLLLNEAYFDECVEFIAICAKEIPDWEFQYREHPEYKLKEKQLQLLSGYSNITDVSSHSLSTVFAQTELAVSVFSSTLMEGVIHHCVPFSYDPAEDSRFYPDLEVLGIGIIAKDSVSGLARMKQFCYDAEYRNTFKKNISQISNKVAVRTSEETLQYIDRMLKKKENKV